MGVGQVIQGIVFFIGLLIFTAICGMHFFGQLPAQQNCETFKKSQDDEEEDWGNLKRYSSSNAQLISNTNEVVFMGDSITDRMDFTKFFKNQSYINRGIDGQTTQQMLLRFRRDVINLRPSVVVILGGTNDLKKLRDYQPVEGIFENIKSMAELAKAQNIQVIIASILPVCGKKVNERPPSDILKVNELLFNYAGENDIAYLDYFSAFVGNDGLLQEKLTVDCLHLNEAGYNLMAPLALGAIQIALSKQRGN